MSTQSFEIGNILGSAIGGTSNTPQSGGFNFSQLLGSAIGGTSNTSQSGAFDLSSVLTGSFPSGGGGEAQIGNTIVAALGGGTGAATLIPLVSGFLNNAFSKGDGDNNILNDFEGWVDLDKSFGRTKNLTADLGQTACGMILGKDTTEPNSYILPNAIGFIKKYGFEKVARHASAFGVTVETLTQRLISRMREGGMNEEANNFAQFLLNINKGETTHDNFEENYADENSSQSNFVSSDFMPTNSNTDSVLQKNKSIIATGIIAVVVIVISVIAFKYFKKSN